MQAHQCAVTLVSSDGDNDVPMLLHEPALKEQLLSSPWLTAWYAQNLVHTEHWYNLWLRGRASKVRPLALTLTLSLLSHSRPIMVAERTLRRCFCVSDDHRHSTSYRHCLC